MKKHIQKFSAEEMMYLKKKVDDAHLVFLEADKLYEAFKKKCQVYTGDAKYEKARKVVLLKLKQERQYCVTRFREAKIDHFNAKYGEGDE